MTVEGATIEQLEQFLGAGKEVNCARPLDGEVRLTASEVGTVRVHRIYHGSVVDGPGLRSVLQVQGCPIRCVGCYVPETHPSQGGTMMSSADVLAAVLDPNFERSGVTILGGEAMAQAEELQDIASVIVAAGHHLTLYTGYTVEYIRDRGTPGQSNLLRLADLVIDGPYVRKLGGDVGEWRGSRNQRILSHEDVHRILKGGNA
ncbi:MAG: 4Fe-4S cluster-binding domain-containing protein, partial [Acidobacteria bacterium]|nr:4Fe-4S cluster-binding domain-containing protein [Acidobacteriota bacterium]